VLSNLGVYDVKLLHSYGVDENAISTAEEIMTDTEITEDYKELLRVIINLINVTRK